MNDKPHGKPQEEAQVTAMVSVFPDPAKVGDYVQITAEELTPNTLINFVVGGVAFGTGSSTDGVATWTPQTFNPGSVQVDVYEVRYDIHGSERVLVGSGTINVVE